MHTGYRTAIHVLRLRPNRTLNSAEQFYYRRVLRSYVWRYWAQRAPKLLEERGGVVVPDLRTLSVVQVSEDQDTTETSLQVTYDTACDVPPEWACRLATVYRGEDPYEQMAAAMSAMPQDDGLGGGGLVN